MKKNIPSVRQTYGEYRYTEISPNPLNPRRIFDKYKLDTLEESIRANKILVPLTVYREKDNKIYILDGERRWRCAQRIERGEVSISLESKPQDLHIPNELVDILTFEPDQKILTHRGPIDESHFNTLSSLSSSKNWQLAIKALYSSSQKNPPKEVVIPVNIVDPPTPWANMLYMFHVHNLREQWELMPTALSLQILMKELKVEDDAKLSELTQLSLSKVRMCKALLNFPNKYQKRMLDPDPDKRLKANLFIEMNPVLDLYEKLGRRVNDGKSREELTDLFIKKYEENLIPSVIHFRRILEAHEVLKDTDRWDEFKIASSRFVKELDTKIRSLFEPLTAEEKDVQDATSLCKDFINKIRKLKVAHTAKRRLLANSLRSVQKEVENLLEMLGED